MVLNIDDIDFDDGKYWAFDVEITPQIIEIIYSLMCPSYWDGPPRPVSEVVWADDVWRARSPDADVREDTKRVIYCLALRKPEIDPMIQSLYVLALKHKKLDLLDHIGDVGWEALDRVFTSSMVWIDQERLLKFYKRYACKTGPFNKIKIPEGFQSCEKK